jgi:hypothetical protein
MPAANDYHFITYWRVRGTVDDVKAVLADPTDLPRWWPSVYLDVRLLDPGDENGLGRQAALHTRGWLPYTLRWSFTVTEVHPNGVTLEARGDFNGRGIWTFVQDEADVLVVYDWKVSADKPLLRNLSFLMRPVFKANHRWAMARGEQSLKLELARRRAARAGALAAAFHDRGRRGRSAGRAHGVGAPCEARAAPAVRPLKNTPAPPSSHSHSSRLGQ